MATCADCGGERHQHSGQRCRACYLALADRRKDERLYGALMIDGEVLERLLREARDRCREPRELLIDIVDHVLSDGLIDAVLDDA